MVDGGGLDADEHLPLIGLRVGHLLQLEHLGPTTPMDDDCAHCGSLRFNYLNPQPYAERGQSGFFIPIRS